MPSSLLGKTIILTGSKVTKSVSELIRQHSGQVEFFPLIETVEADSVNDAIWLQKIANFDWLIFTSQNAVTYFLKKCTRHNVNVKSLKMRIAAVGEKTAQLLREQGLVVDFMPTIYSADTFVREFSMEPNERALFLRGSLAKSTIREGVGADEWTVYETQPCTKYIEQCKRCLSECKQPFVVFASPSAVDVYAEHIAPTHHFVPCASIGHVTTKALAKFGIVPNVQPKTYTMQAVIEQLILEENLK